MTSWVREDGMVRTLRLTQGIEGSGYRVELALEGDGARRVAVARFSWELAPQDREDIRWYLEDYLQYPIEPAPRAPSGCSSPGQSPTNMATASRTSGTGGRCWSSPKATRSRSPCWSARPCATA
ncbi:MAG: hypothetical protein ACRDZ4_14175 [Egibacteraceae bacterium]